MRGGKLLLVLAAMWAVGACGGSSNSATGASTSSTAAPRTSPTSSAASATSTSMGVSSGTAATKPCDAVSKADLASVFGTTVSDGTTTDLDKGGCQWDLAGGSQGRKFIFYFPGTGMSYSTTVPDAVGYVNDQRHQATQYTPGQAAYLQMVSGAGDVAYINTQTLTMWVGSRPDFAFREQYVRGADNRMQPPTADELAKMKAMAAKIIARHHG